MFNKRHEDVQSHAFLTSTLDGDEWSDSRSGHFIPRKWPPGTHWTGSWVGTRADLEAMAQKIPSLPLPRIEPQSSSA